MITATLGRLSPEEHRLLGQGRVAISAFTNVAPGTWGDALMSLRLRGLMKSDRTSDHTNTWSVYTVTRAGRDLYVSYGPPYVPITGDET